MKWENMNRQQKIDRAKELIQTTTAWQFQAVGIAFNNLWHEILISVRLDHRHKRRFLDQELTKTAEEWLNALP